MLRKIEYITDDKDKLWYELDGNPDSRQGPFDDFAQLFNHLKQKLIAEDDIVITAEQVYPPGNYVPDFKNMESIGANNEMQGLQREERGEHLDVLPGPEDNLQQCSDVQGHGTDPQGEDGQETPHQEDSGHGEICEKTDFQPGTPYSIGDKIIVNNEECIITESSEER
jgi:hypothetical protein